MTSIGEAVSAIERSLSRLWVDDDATRGGVRALTTCLVAVSGRSNREQFVTDVDDLAARLGARTCIVTVDPSAEPWHLGGEVSAVCRVASTGQGANVCAERVELTFGAVAARRARSVIDALVDAALPLVVYGGPGAHPSILEALAPASDRLIVDSADLGTAAAARLAPGPGGRVEDLAFLRLRNWREMLARGFDDPAHAPAAHEVRRVDVSYVGGDRIGARAHAELVVGWLAAQLAWRVEPGRIERVDGTPVEVHLAAVERPSIAASLLDAVTVHAETKEGAHELTVARDDDPAHLRWSLRSRGATVERTFAVTRRSHADLVCRAAEEVRRTDVGDRALALAARWIGA